MFGDPLGCRGERLDESLKVLTALLSGEPVDFDGAHLHVHAPAMRPTPVQARVPIWVGGWWPNRAPFERAARYQGVVPGKVDSQPLLPEDLRAIRTAIGRTDDGFDVVASGTTTGPDDSLAVAPWRQAGATWWLESLHSFGQSTDAMRERIQSGPPTL